MRHGHTARRASTDQLLASTNGPNPWLVAVCPGNVRTHSPAACSPIQVDAYKHPGRDPWQIDSLDFPAFEPFSINTYKQNTMGTFSNNLLKVNDKTLPKQATGVCSHPGLGDLFLCETSSLILEDFFLFFLITT